VLQPLLAEQPQQLTIANRTVAKAHQLAALFADLGALSGCGFGQLAGQRFDVIINATAASLHNAMPPLPEDVLSSGGCCYDVFYADQATAFVRWARAHGAGKALDGMGMLVEQAAESFSIWRGVRPQTTPVLAALR
jgi:shikimate dehydrogenase